MRWKSKAATVADLLEKAKPSPPPENATIKKKMAYRLKTNEVRAIYKRQKATLEPVFGIVKTILDFREFLLRGLEKVAIEWDLATLAYNFNMNE